MKKIILFLGFLLTVSCTNNINDTCVAQDLSESEQLILSQADTTIYKHAIVIDDVVLVFDDPSKAIIKVTNYAEPINFIAFTIMCVFVLGGLIFFIITFDD